MASRPRKKIRKKLRKVGFVKEEAARHEKWRFQPYGITTDVYGVISRGSGYKDYSGDILSWLADELKLSNPQMLKLIDCQIDLPGLLDLYLPMGVFEGKESELLTKREGHEPPED